MIYTASMDLTIFAQAATKSSELPGLWQIVISGIAGFVGAIIVIGMYKNKVDNLESTVGKDEHSGLRKTVGDIRDKVVACEATLNERGPLTKRKSPVSLTERGAEFLKKSHGEEFIDQNFDELLEKVNAMNPKTAYDVQEDARKVVEELRTDERINPIKEFLFKDGSTLNEAFEVMSIYLRNKILTHKQWNVEDIDHQEGTEANSQNITK